MRLLSATQEAACLPEDGTAVGAGPRQDVRGAARRDERQVAVTPPRREHPPRAVYRQPLPACMPPNRPSSRLHTVEEQLRILCVCLTSRSLIALEMPREMGYVTRE